MPADIPGHSLVGFLLGEHLSAWELSGPEGTETLQFDPPVKVGNSLVLRDLLVAGQGIGTLPNFISDPAEALTLRCPRTAPARARIRSSTPPTAESMSRASS